MSKGPPNNGAKVNPSRTLRDGFTTKKGEEVH